MDTLENIRDVWMHIILYYMLNLINAQQPRKKKTNIWWTISSHCPAPRAAMVLRQREQFVGYPSSKLLEGQSHPVARRCFWIILEKNHLDWGRNAIKFAGSWFVSRWINGYRSHFGTIFGFKPLKPWGSPTSRMCSKSGMTPKSFVTACGREDQCCPPQRGRTSPHVSRTVFS